MSLFSVTRQPFPRATLVIRSPKKSEGCQTLPSHHCLYNANWHKYFCFQFGDDHFREIEELWAALVICWPNNLKVVIHYLVIIVNMAAAELLPYVSIIVKVILL